ncbi:MAG TPA: twin-arginine translocase TatA/TatE family subunit [Candidatus Limisoma intestinavium]|uniref:Sec-independent protein translocase protein TatA n=1 Tax=Candidatus Limisoma intestinavium TaxID=2840856 RepID=A0A9D1IKP4_9BACT|nr:twin-arginine translocase TatA/TatE family subunit [Candidatus Limisoma intestinavium]
MSDVLLLFGTLGWPEIIVIALIVLLLFGGKKIPELMRGIGKGIRSFKEGMNDVKEEINKPVEPTENGKQEEK